MVSSYVFFTIFLIIVYSLIWTGSCRMGCRPTPLTEVDGLSTLSGMVVPLSDQEDLAHICVCESCPCELIENFFKACRPITGIYTGVTNTASNCTNSVWNKFYGAYDRVARVLECRASCRRQAQLVNSRSTFNSSENFTIVEKPVNESAPTPSVSGAPKSFGAELVQTFSEIANKISGAKKLTKSSGSDAEYSISPSGSRSPQEPKTSKGPKEKQKKSKKIQVERTLSEETLRPATSVLENCSKCAELGKVCIGGCPSAEEKRRKNEK